MEVARQPSYLLFGDYHDPNTWAFRDLRVINEERVDPSAGLSTHSHRDMEIITYVLGALAHKDRREPVNQEEILGVKAVEAAELLMFDLA